MWSPHVTACLSPPSRHSGQLHFKNEEHDDGAGLVESDFLSKEDIPMT